MKKRLFLFGYIMVLSMIFVLPAVAQEGLPDWTNLGAVISWLAVGGGAPIIVGMIFAYIAENIPAWHTLPKWVKFTVPVVIAVLVGVGANYLLLQSDLIKAISPYWALIMSILLAWFGSQVGYMQTKRAGYGANYKKLNRG
ncbi:MAG: hypothetical protein LUQ37_05875 [Methanoregulaceae archaeon]|jgi:fructose-specific phosphotransferase system IIC component|nr:hypothetical protein [Methanoregulaceae archaeon]